MENISTICVDKDITVSEGLKNLNDSGTQILFVLDGEKLVGVVTDGDIRRWILNNGDFSAKIKDIMCTEPRIVHRDNQENARKIMLDFQLNAIPVVENGKPVDVIFLKDLLKYENKIYEKINIPVVIMAGGKGSRLYPYTQVLPKPLIPIGTTTIVERIIESFYKNGCNEFWLTLNYKKNLIKAYFKDQELPYHMHYVEEEDYYGTCGSLKELEGVLKGTFIVSNCDVLLDIDYADVLKYHNENCNKITVVTAIKNMQIPYGVFELEKGKIVSITEKPLLNYNINTGIYVIESEVLQYVPNKKEYHMTDLLMKLLQKNERIGAYPITDNCWDDMGQLDEMSKMINTFEKRESEK